MKLQELSRQRDLNSPDVSTMLSHIDFSTATTSLDSVTSLQGIFELEGDCNVVLQGRIGQVILYKVVYHYAYTHNINISEDYMFYIYMYSYMKQVRITYH